MNTYMVFTTMLHKASTGLKQAPRAWYFKLRSVLEGMGFTASVADPGLIILSKGSTSTYLLFYVDDMLVVVGLHAGCGARQAAGTEGQAAAGTAV